MKIPNNCNESRSRCDTNKSTLSLPRKLSDVSSISSNATSDTFYSASSEMPLQQSSSGLGGRRMTWTCGRPVAIDKMVNKLEIPHTFVIHSYKRPTVCHVCKKLVRNSIFSVLLMLSEASTALLTNCRFLYFWVTKGTINYHNVSESKLEENSTRQDNSNLGKMAKNQGPNYIILMRSRPLTQKLQSEVVMSV